MASLSADQGFHLLRDSKNFDFSIECNGIVVRAHADLLAVKTQYLAVCVQGQFKVSRIRQCVLALSLT